MRTLFHLDKIAVAATTGMLAKGAHVVSALHPSDKDDCAGADNAPFPLGAFATFPRYFQATYVTPVGGTTVKGHRGSESATTPGWLGGGDQASGANSACVAVPRPGKWSVYRADAYRACAAANEWAAGAAPTTAGGGGGGTAPPAGGAAP